MHGFISAIVQLSAEKALTASSGYMQLYIQAIAYHWMFLYMLCYTFKSNSAYKDKSIANKMLIS